MSESTTPHVLIARQRGGKPPSLLQGVRNELLKIIPTFREREGRLLVCATTSCGRSTRRSCATAGSST